MPGTLIVRLWAHAAVEVRFVQELANLLAKSSRGLMSGWGRCIGEDAGDDDLA
jgi:hypothetical protein